MCLDEPDRDGRPRLARFTTIFARAIFAGGRPASGTPFLVARGLLVASLLLAFRLARPKARFGFAGDAPEV